jgi:AcrR family transcriptional regulator
MTSEVLTAARAELAERGVEATSIEDLRRATGLSVGSLYHRFGSKEGLAAAVYAEALGDYQAAAIERLRRSPDAEGGVRALVEGHLEWHVANPDRARFLHENGGIARREPGRELVAEHNEEFLGEAGRWWRTHVGYGTLRDLPFDLAYVLWLGAAQEYCRLWLAGATRVGTRTAKRALADGAWNALRDEGS